MADTNVRITLTATDELTPALQRSAASFDLVQRALDQFDKQMQAAGNSQAKTASAITQATQFMQALGATTTATGQTLDKFGAQIDQSVVKQLQAMQAGIAAANADLGRLQQFGIGTTQEISSLSAALGQFAPALSVATGLLAAFGVSLSLRSLVDFGQSVVETGIKIQGLQLAFKGIGGSAQSGAADFAFITRESQRLGLELLSTATTFRNFEAAAKGSTLEGQQARDIFTAVAGAARVLGIQGGELQRVFLAVDRMMQTNVINARELRLQLGTALPGSIEILARALGITTQQLFEMTKQGTLLATEALPALARGLREELGGSVGEAGTLASTAFARLGNELTLMKDRIAQSGLLDAMRAIANAGATILETQRKLGDERQRQLGGPLPALPAGAPISPAIQARQAEIEAQRADLNELLSQRRDLERRGAQPQGMIDEMTARLVALQAEQRKAIEAFQRSLSGEGGPGAIGPTGSPLVAVEERIRTLLEEGRKKLIDIDLNAEFIPSLTTAEDKLKAWQETLKAVREELTKLSEPLRRTLGDTGGGTPSPFRALIGPLAAARGIDPALIEALVAQESGNDPNIVSRRGARGLMQLMPATAARYGAAGREFDPESNLRAGIAYLADLLKMFSGDVVKALTAYNAGPRGGGIPQATGENATFAQDVLRRMPQGLAGVVGAAAAQEEALRSAVEAGKPDAAALQRTLATGRAYHQALDEEIRLHEQAAATLQRLTSAYTQTKEARDEDTAALLKAKFPQDEAIQQAADTVIALAATRAAYKDEVAALQERFIALKQATDATREQEEAQTAYLQKLKDTLTLLQTPKDERAETQLRALAGRQGVVLGPQEEGLLGAITAAERTRSQAREMDQIATRLAGNIRQTFDSLWEQVFTGGVTSFRQLGQVVVQSLQRMFAQLTAQIMGQLLNATTGTTDEKGGWAGVLARGVVGLGTAALGGSTGTAPTPGLEALFGLGGVVTGLGPIRALAGGAVIDRPSYALLGERPGSQEAVIPMVGGSVPVAFTGQQSQQQQPIVIHIVNDYTGAVSPSSLKTGKREIIQHIINDYKSDGPIRRTFRAG